MKEGSRRVWPFVLVGGLALVAYLSTLVEITTGDLRPKGESADVYGLRFRDDTNVLFVLIDTLRADRLGAYGYDRETSPTLDYLASTGVRFARHLSQSSWTKCSMASLWTSLYPVRSGVTRFDHALPEAARLPAEVFREAGFTTAGIWRNGWVAANFGFDQGFEVYERPRPRPVPPEVRRDNPHVQLQGTDLDVVENAIEFLRIHGRDRWFLYLHLMDVHQYVYDEASAAFGASYSDVYDNSILFTDTNLGRLLTHLADTGLLEKTLVVVTSDHGEAFSERGYEGHARMVDRETTEIPLILDFPFKLDPGVTVDVRSRNVDVWPTVLDLLGLPALDDSDGRSLVPEILAAVSGEAPPADETLAFSFLDRTWGQAQKEVQPVVAVVEGPYRFVYGVDGPERTTEQLFDASEDRLERRNVIAEHPDVADALREEARAHLEDPADAPWGGGPVSVELDAMELNQLRALGYEL